MLLSPALSAGAEPPWHSYPGPGEPAVQPAHLACKAITTGRGANLCFYPINWEKMVSTVKRPPWPSSKAWQKRNGTCTQASELHCKKPPRHAGDTLCLPRDRVSDMVSSCSPSSGVKIHPSFFLWPCFLSKACLSIPRNHFRVTFKSPRNSSYISTTEGKGPYSFIHPINFKVPTTGPAMGLTEWRRQIWSLSSKDVGPSSCTPPQIDPADRTPPLAPRIVLTQVNEAGGKNPVSLCLPNELSSVL